MMGDAEHVNLTYEEFIIELHWLKRGDEWAISVIHRHLTLSAPDEPSLLREPASAELLGKRIGLFLLPADVGTFLDQELTRVAHVGKALRIVIVLPEPTLNPGGPPFNLEEIPWEAAQYGAHDTFLFAMKRVSIVRRWNSRKEDLFSPDHRRLVFMDASRSVNNAAQLEADFPHLGDDEWDVLGNFDDPQPTARNVADLAMDKVAIFHFTGHGDSAGLFLDGGGSIYIGKLSDALQNTRLAVLSACDSAGGGLSPHRSGLAAELAKTVPAVIGMSSEVIDLDAQIFSGELYRHLVRGYSLDESVRLGRLKLLEQKQHTLAFALPVFYLGVTGSTRPVAAQATMPPTGANADHLVEPLAVVRGKNGNTVYGIQSSRTGLRVVKLEQAGTSPALLAFDARVAASQSGNVLTIGDILADTRPGIDPTNISLPPPFEGARVIAVSKGYRTRTLRLVITDGETTKLVTRGFEWLPPKTLDAGFAAAAALDNTLGTLLLDSADGQVISVQGGSAEPFSLPKVSGFDSAYSSGVGVALAWGTDGTKTALEVQRWDERLDAIRSRDPQWVEVEVDLRSFDASRIIRAGVVRELTSGAVPHTIAVQFGEVIELIELPDAGPAAPRTWQ